MDLQDATDRNTAHLTPTTTLTARLAKVRTFYFFCVCSVLSFSLVIPLSHRLLLRVNMRDRFETLAQCAKLSQFAYQRFWEMCTKVKNKALRNSSQTPRL